MDEFIKILPYLITVIASVGGAYVTVRVTIAEMKRDISHVQGKLENEIIESRQNMTEIRSDMKNISSSLTNLQVSIAYLKGKQDEKDQSHAS